jgi:ribosomal protein L24E
LLLVWLYIWSTIKHVLFSREKNEWTIAMSRQRRENIWTTNERRQKTARIHLVETLVHLFVWQ